MRTYLMTVAISLSACVDQAPDLDRRAACEEQAAAWCTATGYPAGGCAIWYVGQACAARDLDIGIPADMQAQCLADIVTGPVPASCEATWSLTR